jgi:hypothetical protein
MRKVDSAQKFVAVVLVFVMVVMTAPLSAADLNTRHVLGAVSASGTVELRGITISRDGTLFSGDSLRSSAKGYAKVSLDGGRNIEVGEKTNLTFSREANVVHIAMNSGTIGFSTTSKDPLTIDVNPYTIVASHAGTGNVAFLDSKSIGVHVTDGSVMVTNKAAGTSFQVTRGQERLFALNNAKPTIGLDEASDGIPSPLPLPKLDPPQAQTPAGTTTAPGTQKQCHWCLDAGGWLAVIGTAALGAGIIGIIVYNNNRSGNGGPSATTLAAKVTAQSNVQVLTASAQQASAVAGQLVTAANNVNTAINASNINAATKSNLSSQATNIASQAQTIQQQLTVLLTQLASVQAQLASTNDRNVISAANATIANIQASLNSNIATLNSLISQLNSVVQQAQAAGVPNVPPLTIQPITPPTLASPSNP